MRRSAELAALSRDHHVALELALALKRTTADDLEHTTARYAAFMAGEGAVHFDEEEAVLVPVLPPDLAERLVREHTELRDPPLGDVAAARRAGELLAAHVRFEERVVFTHLEQTLPAAELADIGRRLADG